MITNDNLVLSGAIKPISYSIALHDGSLITGAIIETWERERKHLKPKVNQSFQSQSDRLSGKAAIAL
jgi:hypothetical protein